MTKNPIKKLISKKQIDILVTIGVAISACLLFWVWYYNGYLKPSNVFWGTIQNNLKVDYITRTSSRIDGNQKLTQVTDLQLTPVLIARSTVKLEDTKTNERVVTETIGTANADFLRYVEIASNNSEGADKSAVGMWAKRDVAKGEQPQVLTDALLGSVLMFGDLNVSQRKDIISQLQSTNAITRYNLVGKKTVDGRKIYSFDVSIDLDAYSKVYANYLKMLGQDTLAAQIGQQQSGAAYDFILDINATSRVPSKLTVGDGADAETFTNVGSGPRFVAPQATLTIAELQAKLTGN